MSSIVDSTEGKSSISLPETDGGSVGGVDLSSRSSQEQWDASPVQVSDPSLSSEGVADDVVLTAVQEDLEVGDVLLGEQVGIVDSIAGSNISEEVVVDFSDAVLVGDVGINTISGLSFRGSEPVIVGD